MAKYAYHRVDANAADLYEYAEILGMSVEKIGRPCDAIVGAFGLSVAVEVKTATGKLRSGQLAFLERFRGAVVVWRSYADVDNTRERLSRSAMKIAPADRWVIGEAVRPEQAVSEPRTSVRGRSNRRTEGQKGATRA